MSSKDVFADFRQAWGARFPGSELPDAWEEDVRANLKKHRTKVAILREELDKEEMYVEYLQTLLKDIEHMKIKSKTEPKTESISLEHVDKQEFLDSHLSDLQKNDFVTVINVSNVDDQCDKSASLPKRNNRDSLRSVSSPISNDAISSSTEDFISREGLAANSSSISSSNASSKEQIEVDLEEVEQDEAADRGQPDGHDDPNDPKKTKNVRKDESNR